MPDRVLTQKVKAKALSMGMDLVGVAPLERYANAPATMGPQALLPTAQSVVVVATHITDCWTEMGGEPTPHDCGPGGWRDHNSQLASVAIQVAQLLKDEGQAAVPVSPSGLWNFRAGPRQMAPALSHIHAGCAAGLGEIGWCGLLITPEFGPRVRLVSIVTDADLVPSPMYSGPAMCDMCMECKTNCPARALDKELLKPHEVAIGGRTFRYANKNLWRCGWAETFFLDLAAPCLNNATVGEADVLAYNLEHGIRGHERGVCQKVCVPPHLRSDRKSFGRDKHITLDRIGRRYGEHMPTLRKLRDDVLAAAADMGLVVSSVAPLQAEDAVGAAALREAPGMRTVLGFAMPISRETARAMRLGRGFAGPYYTATYHGLHFKMMQLARLLEDAGYYAAAYTGRAGQVGMPERLAAMAGAGRCGETFMTAEFGGDVVAGAITTDAPLDATPVVEGVVPHQAARCSPQALRGELRDAAQRRGARLFGVADAAVLDQAAEQLRAGLDEAALAMEVVNGNNKYFHQGPWESQIVDSGRRVRGASEVLAGAKSVVVVGMTIPPEVAACADGKPEAFHFYRNWALVEARLAAWDVAMHLERQGYRTLIADDLLGSGSDVPWYESIDWPDMRANALVGVAAGLGCIGRSGVLLTDGHGPLQRLVAVVTDAPLPADAPATGDPCGTCRECERICPTRALGDSTLRVQLGDCDVHLGGLEPLRCDWSKKYALCPAEGPGHMGDQTRVSLPEGPVTLDALAAACTQRDPLQRTHPVIVEHCVVHCPKSRR